MAVLSLACSGGGGGARRDETSDFSRSGLLFSQARGLYDEPFELEITHPEAAEILYTLDCSDPRSSNTAQRSALPARILVDPSDTTARFRAPGVIVRAYPLGGDDHLSSVSTHTYLFPGRVVELSPDGQRPGDGWPRAGSSSQVMDYGMDPDVTSAPAYADSIEPSLRALPSVSLCTDLGNLFDEEMGIYVNAERRGTAPAPLEWERPSSFEILYPNGRSGLGANAGLRIRGGYSRSDENPKHAFRLLFRADYGPSTLEYPLFEDEGASRFDKIDFRTSQNYSWSFDGSEHNTMNRDVFSRDLQRELGRPYTRSRYYHLYLDGVYWGLYQSQERAEAKYAESYFGGDSVDYDTVKVASELDYSIEATDGTLDAWREIWSRSELGFSDDTAVYALEGLDPSGAPDPAGREWVDLDNLIDYMLVIFYTGNYDAPASEFFENERPNNFVAIASRADPDLGFVFFTHDNEHTLHVDPVRVGSGLEQNRVEIGDMGYPNRMVVNELEHFHPQWLHYRLCENAGYRERFGRRAKQLLEHSGPMTPSAAAALFRRRALEIELAIVAESARWGDAKATAPFTRDDHWTAELQEIEDEWFPARTAIVIGQLRDAGLYPE